MTAPAHLTTARSRKRAGTGHGQGVQTRLPWWALLLPALGFAILFVLLLGGGQADAAQQTTESPVLAFLAQVRNVLLG